MFNALYIYEFGLFVVSWTENSVKSRKDRQERRMIIDKVY